MGLRAARRRRRQHAPQRRAHRDGIPGVAAHGIVEERLRRSSAASWRWSPPATTRRASPAATSWRRCARKIGARRPDRPGRELDLLGRARAARGGLVGARATVALHPRPPAHATAATAGRRARRRTRTTRPRRCSRCTPRARAAAAGRSRTPIGYLASAQTLGARLRAHSRAARPTASRPRGRSRPAHACGLSQHALARRGCSPASCRAGRSTTSPARRITPGLRHRPGAAGRARQVVSDPVAAATAARRRPRRSGRSRAAAGPRASWSRRRERPRRARAPRPRAPPAAAGRRRA